LLGDKHVFLKFLYKDAIIYYRSYYNTLSDEAISERMFKSLSQSYNEQINRFQRHGIEFSMVIPSLIRKVKQGNNIFIVFNITSNLCSESLYTHFADYEQFLGISHNNGQNWSFIEMNNDAINILRISNDEEVINAVLRR
jgi:monomeric isocitrate dehydrogenase